MRSSPSGKVSVISRSFYAISSVFCRTRKTKKSSPNPMVVRIKACSLARGRLFIANSIRVKNTACWRLELNQKSPAQLTQGISDGFCFYCGLITHAFIRVSIWSRISRNLASFSSSVPTKAAGSSKDQCSRLLMPGQVLGQFFSASSQTVIRY